MIETVIGTREIFSGRILHLRVDDVRLANGLESKREIVEHRGAVCIVPITDSGDILMVRQFRLAAGGVLLEVPAGTLEAGEDPRDCALRELEEETGYRAATIRPLFAAFASPGYCTEKIHAFLATGLTHVGDAHTDADEAVEMEFMRIDEVDAKLASGEIQDMKTVAALLAARRVIEGSAK
jgi:8-oxo-dGTP pyrophosphatase MutT (NUDIX family)